VNKTGEAVRFFIITFILSLLPYIIVAINLRNETDAHLRGFFGDGSILTLCTGIMCSYLMMLFDFNFKKPNEKAAVRTSIVILILFLIYIGIGFQFYFCQLNFNRAWGYINPVICLSGALLLFTFLVAFYLQFTEKITSIEITNFIEAQEKEKIEKKAKNTSSSQEGTAV
jgi:hypothetical protein